MKPTKLRPPITEPFTIKDQSKGDQADRFIGHVSEYFCPTAPPAPWDSSPIPADTRVFISAEGQRDSQIAPDFEEIGQAVQAGVTCITNLLGDGEVEPMPRP